MPSSQSSLPRNSKGRFRKGTYDARRYGTNPSAQKQRKKKHQHSDTKSNPSSPKQPKKKRKLDLTPTLKHQHLSENDHDFGVRRSQRIKYQTHRKKKRKLDLTPPDPFRLNKKGLRRSRRIKGQKQEAKSLKKAKRLKRRKRKQQKSSVSSISKHNNSSQSNYQKKATE
eukprot:144889_1